MSPTKLLVALGLAVALAACSMAPRYEQPESPIAGQMDRLQTPIGTEQATAEQISWREFYRGEQLQRLLALALESNRNLRVAALNVEQVQAQYRIQRAGLLPSLGATASGTRQRVPEAVSQTGSEYTTTQYSVGLGVAAWELDLFGRVNSLRAGALEQYLATLEARRGVQLSLAAQVGESYFTWVASRALLDLSADTLERHLASYEMVKRRHERGIASSLDVSQAASSVHAARVDVARYQRQVDQSFTALELLVGAPLDPDEIAGSGSLAEDVISDVPVALDSEVLLRRPDIQQAEHALRAANANIGAARAAFFPRIALTASAGSASNELSGLFKSGTGTWSFIPQVTLPIFTWGANKAALDVAQLRKESSIAQYELAIQSAFKEALDGLQALTTLNEQLTAQADLLEASAQSLELAQIRYEKGVDSYLEMLVAQRAYNAAQQALVNVRLAQLQNKIALFRALGGGVSAS